MTPPAVGADSSIADEPTLFAVSSGPPPAAIAIVRISGTRAGTALATLAGRLPPPRRATIRALCGPDGALLDRALVLWFPGPATATGEDLAELHLHGGRAVIAAVLGALAKMPGLAPAPPGAFTRRAFANGLIDLTEAEGLADLLAAESESQRRQALLLAEGGLGRLLDGWRLRVLDIAARIEAAIDYEDEADVPPPVIEGPLAALREEIGAALAAPPAERLRDGVRIVIAGPVNAGKSSLLNKLAGRDAAIVSDLAGTTRDLIEVPIILDGVPIVLIDSAGLRTSADSIEQVGMARAQSASAQADLILWLGEPAACPRSDAILVAAKCDIMPAVTGEGVPVSSLTGNGMDMLRTLIVQRTRDLTGRGDRVALNVRHRTDLAIVHDSLAAAATECNPLLVAENLRVAMATFDAITGRSTVDEMLDALFLRFCVGK